MSSIKQEQADLDTMLNSLDELSKTKTPSPPAVKTIPIEAPPEISEEMEEQIVEAFYNLIEQTPEICDYIMEVDLDEIEAQRPEGFERNKFEEALHNPTKVRNLILSLQTQVNMLEARLSLLEGNVDPAMALVSECLGQPCVCNDCRERLEKEGK